MQLEVEILGYYLTAVAVANPDGRADDSYAQLLKQSATIAQVTDGLGNLAWVDDYDGNEDRKIWETLDEAKAEIKRLISLPEEVVDPEDDMPGYTTLADEMEDASGYGAMSLSGTTRFMITPVIRAKTHLYQEEFTYISREIPN